MKKKLLRVAALLACVAMAITLTVFAQGLLEQDDPSGASQEEPEAPAEEEAPGDEDEDGDEAPGDQDGGESPGPGDEDGEEAPQPGDEDGEGDPQPGDENGGEDEEPGAGDGGDQPGDGAEGPGGENPDGEEPDGEDTEPPTGEEPIPGEDEAPAADALADAAPTIELDGEVYLLFEVGDQATFRSLLNTSYPADGIRSLYLRLTDSVDAGSAMSVNPSVLRVAVDGQGEHTLRESGIISASSSLREVRIFDLDIRGSTNRGFFTGGDDRVVDYYYRNVTFSGPQMIHAQAGRVYIDGGYYNATLEEVAQAREITLAGEIDILHQSVHSVFWTFQGGDLTLTKNTRLTVEVDHSGNQYVFFPNTYNSDLVLQEGASFVIRGNPQRFTRAENILRAIRLEEGAEIDWESSSPSGMNMIILSSVSSLPESEPSLYLAPGSSMRVASTGPFNGGSLLLVQKGMVVVEPGARLEISASDYRSPSDQSPVRLLGGGIRVGGNAAEDRGVFVVDVNNINQLTHGLVRLDNAASRFEAGENAVVFIRGSRFAWGAVCFQQAGARLSVDPGAMLVVRANSVAESGGGAVFFNSKGELHIDNPGYIEIATGNSRPFSFYEGGSASLTGLGQLGHWVADAPTRLSGGTPLRRWLAEDEPFGAEVTVGSRNSSFAARLTGGELDENWLTGTENFDWTGVRLLSMGTLELELGAVEEDLVSGAIRSPRFGETALLGGGAAHLLRQNGTDWERLSDVEAASPGFALRPYTALSQESNAWVEAEYRYLFGLAALESPGPALSLVVPQLLQFPDTVIEADDKDIRSPLAYQLQVVDRRGPDSEPWRITATFEGLADDLSGRTLQTHLLLNQKRVDGEQRELEKNNGSMLIDLEAVLFVPGGAAHVGSYRGTVCWQLTDAP